MLKLFLGFKEQLSGLHGVMQTAPGGDRSRLMLGTNAEG
jgi:hypothetical protein